MPRKPKNPHDVFMKVMVKNVARARNFLEEFLPAPLLEKLDLSALRHEKTDFAIPELKEYFSDIVFSARLKNPEADKECLVSILIEHKSFIDKYTPFQILLYLAEAYRVQLDNKEVLRPIIPLLYYHGGETWNLKPLPELFDKAYGDIRDFVPRFETVFADMSLMPDKEIEKIAHTWLRAAILTQKYSHNPKELVRRFLQIFQSASQIGTGNFFLALVVYYFSLVRIPKDQLTKLIETMPTEVRQNIVSTYDMIIQEGIREGIQKGIEEGLQKGIEEGIDKTNRETILRGRQIGLSIQILSEITGLSETEVQAIIAKS